MKSKFLFMYGVLAGSLALTISAFAAGPQGGALGGALGNAGGISGTLNASGSSINAAGASSYDAMVNERVQGLAHERAIDADAHAKVDIGAHVPADASPVGSTAQHVTRSALDQPLGSADQVHHRATTRVDSVLSDVAPQNRLIAQDAQGAVNASGAANVAGSATGGAALDGKSSTDTLRGAGDNASRQVDEGVAAAQRARDHATSHANRAIDNASKHNTDARVKGSASGSIE